MIVRADIESPRPRSHAHGFRVTARGSFRTTEFLRYQGELHTSFRRQIPQPLAGRHLRLSIDIVYPQKRGQKAFRVGKGTSPDLGNLCKAIEDALEGVAYADDRVIDELHLRRFHELGVRKHRIRVEVCENSYELPA